MTPVAPGNADNVPPPGIDRSINQDDDLNHDSDDRPVPHARDTLTGTDAFKKPGLVDTNGAPHA